MCACVLWHVVVVVIVGFFYRLQAGHILHSDGVYMLSEMPVDIGTRALTVQEIMRMNFQSAWPSMDVLVLQVEAHHGAAMQWKELIVNAGGQDCDVFFECAHFNLNFCLVSLVL